MPYLLADSSIIYPYRVESPTMSAAGVGGGVGGGGGGGATITGSGAPPDPPPQALSPIKPARISDEPSSLRFDTMSPLELMRTPIRICSMVWRRYIIA